MNSRKITVTGVLNVSSTNTAEHNFEFAPGSQVRLIAQLHAKLVVPQSFGG
jgi:hypothetical protein